MSPQFSRASALRTIGSVVVVAGLIPLMGIGASVAAPPVSIVVDATAQAVVTTAPPETTTPPTTTPPQTTTPPTTAPPTTATASPTEEPIDGGGTNEGGPPGEGLGDQAGGQVDDTAVRGTKLGQLPSTGGSISAYLFLALALILAGATLTAGTIRRSPKRRY